MRRAALLAALATAELVAGRAARDALFLAVLPPSSLAEMLAAAAAVSVLSTWGAAWLLARLGPERVLASTLTVNVFLLGIEYSTYAFAPEWTAIALYLHTSALSGVTLTAFWSWINERYDPHAAKKIVGPVVSGAALGGFAGSLLVERTAAFFGGPSVLVLVLAISLVAAWIVPRQPGSPEELRSEPAASSSPEKPWGYISMLGALLFLLSSASTFGDYAFKVAVQRVAPDAATLARVFSWFDAGVSLGTFAFQSALTGPLLRKNGLKVALQVRPLAVVALAAGALVSPSVGVLLAMRGLGAMLGNSVHRSSYELLFTPLSPPVKRWTKGLVGVASSSAGDGAAAAILVLIAGFDLRVAILGALLSAVGAWGCAFRLGKGYVDQLSASLKRGTADLRGLPFLDETTARTFSQTAAGLNRLELLKAIEESIRPADPDEIGHAIAQLDGSSATEAARLLSSLLPEASGRLSQALADPNTSRHVRSQLVGVLVTSTSQESFNALLTALADPDASVRRRATRALSRLKARAPELQCHKEPVFHALGKLLDGTGAPAGAVSSASRGSEASAEEDRREIFTVLGLVVDRAQLRMVRQALASADVRLRGTAIEYLEQVLPADLAERLVERLFSEWPEAG